MVMQNKFINIMCNVAGNLFIEEYDANCFTTTTDSRVYDLY